MIKNTTALPRTIAVLLTIAGCFSCFIGCSRDKAEQSIESEATHSSYSETATGRKEEPSSQDQTESEMIAYPPLIGEYLQENRDLLYGILPLHNGDFIAAIQDKNAKSTVQFNGKTYERSLFIDFFILSEQNQKLVDYRIGYSQCKLESTDIFYEDPSFPESPSRYLYWPKENPTEVIILITPAKVFYEPYEESEWYGVEPADSLQTKPFRIQDPDWYEGFPVWIFDVPLDQITPEYSLTFGHFLLTGEEILNKTWTWQRNDPNGYRDPIGGVHYIPIESTEDPTGATD